MALRRTLCWARWQISIRMSIGHGCSPICRGPERRLCLEPVEGFDPIAPRKAMATVAITGPGSHAARVRYTASCCHRRGLLTHPRDPQVEALFAGTSTSRCGGCDNEETSI